MSETHENIVQFPVDKVVRVLPNGINTLDDVELYTRRLHSFRRLVVREYLSTIIPSLFNQLSVAGFDMTNVTVSPDAAMIVESVKSFIDKQLSIEHPFQDLALELFKLDPATEIIVFNMDHNIVKDHIHKDEEGVKEGSE